VLGQASISGTPSTAVPDWSDRWAIQRSASTWTVSDSGSIAVDGDLYAPLTSVVAGGTAQLGMLTAIVGSLSLGNQAVMMLDDGVDALETAVVPGRARLVR